MGRRGIAECSWNNNIIIIIITTNNNEEVRRYNTAAPHVLRGGILHDVGAPLFLSSTSHMLFKRPLFVRLFGISSLSLGFTEKVTCTSWSYDSSRLYFYLDIDLFAAMH